MAFTSTWRRAFEWAGSRKVILVTLAFGPRRLRDDVHLAETAGVVRCATHADVRVTGATGTFAFTPSLLSWPLVRRSWSPSDRRAELTTVRVDIGGKANLPMWIDSVGGNVAGFARVDLWTDGATLREAIPLVAGPFRLEANDRRAGAFAISVSDFDLDSSPQATDGALDSVEFPDAPEGVVGVAQRQLVLGAGADRTPLHQIDQTGLRFYWTDGRAESPPDRIDRGQTRIPIPFRMRVAQTAGIGAVYTELVFDRAPWSVAADGPLTCSGGYGLGGKPLFTLIERIGGFSLTPRARLTLDTLPFGQRVLIGSEADVLSLVGDRILPQTDAVLAYRLGRIDVLRYAEPAGQLRLALGSGLRARLPIGQATETAVANVIRVAWGRVASGSTPATQTGGVVTVSPATAGLVGELCAASMERYGRRPVAIEAPDLDSEVDALRLAQSMAVQMAFSHRLHRYSARWLYGMQCDLNTRVLLTDEVEGLDEEPTRVVAIEYAPTDPVLTLQTEDQGRAALLADAA